MYSVDQEDCPVISVDEHIENQPVLEKELRVSSYKVCYRSVSVPEIYEILDEGVTIAVT